MGCGLGRNGGSRLTTTADNNVLIPFIKAETIPFGAEAWK